VITQYGGSGGVSAQLAFDLALKQQSSTCSAACAAQ
jgi:hypothetical protein